MNITPEEQNALVQFFGTVHAQAKQTDDMIVGSSKFVNPISPTIKRELEQVLRFNTAQPPQQVQEPEYHPAPVFVQSVPEIEHHSPPQPVESINIAGSEILNTLKEINLNLSRIASTLEKQHGSTKRTKNTKSS